MVGKAFSLIFMIGLLSCSSGGDDPVPPASGGQDDDDIVAEPDNIVFDATFAGLTDLPPDTGGEHIAKPIENLLSPLGHYIYLPGGYDGNALQYPLIVFLHGAGEQGDSRVDPAELDRVLTHGPPSLIENNNWNPTYPSIVVSPQTNVGDWVPATVHGFINYLLNNYQVNDARIYLTGLSMGGRGCWSYVAELAENSHASAIVPICGNGNPSQADQLGSTPIWAFHGEEDNIISAFGGNGSVPMVERINDSEPLFPAKVTIYPGVGHDSWTRTYNNAGMGDESAEYDAFNMSIYDWMFQYRKDN